jgi:tetratricopeptide (TPR) repeat protein
MRTPAIRRLIFAASLLGRPLGAGLPVLMAAPDGSQLTAAPAPELLFDQGKRLFDGLQYDQAVPIFDRLIATLTAGGQPPRADVLVPAYHLRGRARFALGDSAGAEQDFAALLTLDPAFALPEGVSPRIVSLFANVRALVVGQIAVSLAPSGDVQIDGKLVAASATATPIDLPAGPHQVAVAREGYRPIAQTVTVEAGKTVPLDLVLERTSATLTFASRPAGVEVVLDNASRGRTEAGEGPDTPSAPFRIADLQPGTHHLTLRRPCYATTERTITIERPADVEIDPISLAPTVARVRIESAAANATVYVDRQPRGAAPLELDDLCEGSHTIEVRGPEGRFIDTREWKAGETATLTATLRSAFAIVSRGGAADPAALDRLAAGVERALAPASRVLFFTPSPGDLDRAMSGGTSAPDWLGAEARASGAPAPRVTRETRRDTASRIAAALDAQGVAAVAAGADPNVIVLSMLAAGSGEPDFFTVDLADTAARERLVETLGAVPPAPVRPAIDVSTVDIAGVDGAVVIRASAGLAAGDVITGADGAPVRSVTDLRAKVAAHRTAAAIAATVTSAGVSRTASIPVTMAPDTIALRKDSRSPDNLLLLELQQALAGAGSATERSAVRLNLAIVHLRLQNWNAAVAELGQLQLPADGSVSAGTAAYLMGLCFEALGRTAEAQAAFAKAAAAPAARLSAEGALVAPLAKARLH